LRRGGNMLVFPEGTTTDGSEVLDFHASLFQPALLAKAAIQPAAIRYANTAKAAAPFVGDDEFVPHLLRILALEEIEVRLDFLPVIECGQKTRNGIGREARNLILDTLRSSAPIHRLASFEPEGQSIESMPEIKSIITSLHLR
jgi:hypothetical protein